MEKYALITGASGGIGLEFVKLFAVDGVNVIAVARNEKKLQLIKELVEKEYGIEFIICAEDLASEGGAQRVYDCVTERGIDIDYLVNNAGFGDMIGFMDSDWERQKGMLDLNIKALTELAYLFGRGMRERGRGRIINLASAAAMVPGPYMAVYYASKSFVLSFSLALSVELEGTGVYVTALCPGPTKTNFEKNANMGKSVMFSMMPPAKADRVARTGYRAAEMRRPIAYAGPLTKALNIASRILPRRYMAEKAAGINQKQE